MSNDRSNDRLLVNSVLRGEKERYSDIVRRYTSAVFAAAMSITRQRETALELTQQTFVRAYERLAFFRSDNLKGWLLTITYHLSINFLARENRHKSISVEGAPEMVDSQYSPEHEERLQLMERAIDALPIDDRDIIRMYYYSRLSTKEIAEQTKMTQSNVLVRLHRIRDRLRRELEKKIYDTD